MFKKAVKFILLGIFLLGIILPNTVSAEMVIKIFYGETCPHCKKAEIFLGKLQEEYPDLKVEKYEVYSNKENASLLSAILQEKGGSGMIRVPVIIMGDEMIIGYGGDETTGKVLRSWVEGKIEPKEEGIVSVPFLGKINLHELSLPALTIVVGALDGFNPCAMWVLLFLIALLINTKSRKRMWLIGGTFIFVSGFVYFLILSTWLNLFLAVGYIGLVRVLIGLVALTVGIWQIRNFFNYKKGICKITDGRATWQNKIKFFLQNKAENIVNYPFSLGIVIGIIILALGINLVEFFCSAGLPAIYTKILSLNHLNFWQYHFYLLIYTFIFMLDDLIIFFVAVITLNFFSIGEKYNHIITLIGGILIAILGFLLLFKPQLLMFA